MLTYLHEAETLAIALDNPPQLSRIAAFLANDLRSVGAYDQAITAGQHARAGAGGEALLQALANQYLGYTYLAQGAYRQAIASLRQTVAAFEGAQRHEHCGQVNLPAVASRAQLARCHANLGTFAEGSALGEEGWLIAEAAGHPGSLMVASWGLGLLSLRQGKLSRALPWLERAMSICREVDFPVHLSLIAAGLGAAYTLGGHVGEAVSLLTQAIEKTTVTAPVDFQA